MTMKSKFLAAGAALMMVPAFVAMPAAAQVAQGVATANFDRAVEASAAYGNAVKQIELAYKTQIDAFSSRKKVLDAELNALAVKYQADAKTNPNNPTLKTQEAAIRAKQAAAQSELGNLSVSFGRPIAYVREQVEGNLEAAIKSAMKKKNIGIIISPEAIMAVAPGNDLTGDVVSELNTTLPSVSVTPPANWQPGQQQNNAAPVAPSNPNSAPQGR
jgi:Skp family chaperone for outer membrane proteins